MPRPLAALRRDRVVQGVLVLAVLAVGARLVGLGARVAHQDEARVGYWTLRFLASGQYEYRPIVHGPFIHVVDRHLFALFGPSDFVARLPMALLGGLLPAAALLFRTRLRDTETVALAALFAANPVLLYYSRFMRQDLPLAVFATFALGFAVRAVDSTGRRRRYYVYVAGLLFGLAATTKENVLLYPVAWAGATALIVDQRLLDADDTLATARGLVPDAPRPAVTLPGGVRRGGLLVFLGTTPVLAAVGGADGNALGVLVLTSGLAYYTAVRGGTVWHLLGGLPLVGVGVLALARPAFNARLTTFVAGVLWVLATLLLADERLFRYDRRVATDGGSPADDAGDDPERAAETADQSGGPGDDAEEESDAADTDPSDAAGPATGADAGTDARREGRRVGPLRARLLPLPPLGVAYVLAFLVVILFYAPRGGGYPAIGPDLGGAGLWSALGSGDVDGLSAVVREATFGTWTDFLGRWAGDAQDHPYLPFFEDFVATLRAGALTLSVAAVGGTLYDRYVGDAREFVAFCAYWGFASVLGYPLVTDIAAPWATIHAIVPLAIPAAVGLAAVYRVGRSELAADGASVPDPDWLAVVAVAVVLLGAGLQVGAAAVDGVYQNPQSSDNELVQYAQSSSTDIKPVIADVRTVAGENDGVDVLWYGDEFDSPNESDHDQPPAGPGWFERLPLAYYTEMESVVSGEDVVINSTTDPAEVRDSDAPVVVSFAGEEGTSVTDPHTDIESFLVEYDRYRGQRFLYDTGVRSSMLYFVDTSRLDDPAGEYGPASPALTDGRPAPALAAAPPG